MKVLAFSGSNSALSINHELLKYCTQFLRFPFDILDLRNYEIPMFNIDLEQEKGFSAELVALYQTLITYDAYIISIPEHNGNFPAFFKNIIDWLTRIERGFFQNKPILLLNAAPGQQGGKSVLQQAEKSFSFFSGNVVGKFILPNFHSFITQDKLDLEKTEMAKELSDLMESFENKLGSETQLEEKI